MSIPDAISVGLVEDMHQTRRMIAQRLNADPRTRVTWEADSIASAQAELSSRAPDVMIVDLGLPDGTGIDLIRIVKSRHAQTHVLVLTVFEDEQKLLNAIDAGARGYLLKDESALGLAEAVVQVQSGGVPLSPLVARHLIQSLSPKANPGTGVHCAHDQLSPREREILVLSAKGYNQAEVAKLLNLKPSTVASYTREIYAKLDVKSRTEAIYEASRLGYLEI